MPVCHPMSLSLQKPVCAILSGLIWKREKKITTNDWEKEITSVLLTYTSPVDNKITQKSILLFVVTLLVCHNLVPMGYSDCSTHHVRSLFQGRHGQKQQKHSLWRAWGLYHWDLVKMWWLLAVFIPKGLFISVRWPALGHHEIDEPFVSCAPLSHTSDESIWTPLRHKG